MCNTLKRIMLVTCAVMLMTGAASAATFMVMEGGTAPYFPDLDTALWTASTYAGGPHTIEVYAGNYGDAGLSVPSNVGAITGMEAGVVFTAPTYQDVDFLDLSGSMGLTLSNMTIQDYSTALHGTDVGDLVVTDIDFGNNGVDGYAGIGDEDGGAIILYDCDDGWFEGLHIHDGERGLRLRGADPSDGNTIRNCLVEHNEQYGIGIGWTGGSNNTIDSNTVIGSEDFGIQIRGAGNSGNVIRGNIVDSCLWEGIVNNGAAGGSIDGNTVSNCAFQITNPSGANDHTGLTFAGIYREGTSSGGNITNNTCFNNGDGVTGFGIGVGNGASISVVGNCLHGHPGVQGFDNGDGTDWWNGNYYSGLTGTTYALDGGMETDNAPVTADASANADPTTYDVFDLVDVTFDWDMPECDPDFPGLASYSFTVDWDPDMLALVDGSYDYDYGTLGDTAFYGQPPLHDAVAGELTFEAANYLAPGHIDAMLAYAQFQVIGIGSTDIELASTYMDSLDVAIITSNTILTLLGEDNEPPMITVSQVAGDIYSWGSPTVFTPDVGNQLIVDISATDQFEIDHVYYRFDGLGWCWLAGGIADDSYANAGYHADFIGAPIPLTPIAGTDDGTVAHTLEVGVWDAGGNFHSATETFYIDWTAPDFTSWAMADPTCPVDAENTNDLTVDLSFVDDGSAATVEFHDGGWLGVKLPYPQATFDLGAGPGLKTHYAYLYDALNNRSPYRMETITVDQLAAVPSATWLVSSPTPAKTNTASIVGDCNFGGGSGAIDFIVTQDRSQFACDDPGWAPIAGEPRPIPITLLGDDGLKTVYFMSRDIAGNIGIDSAQIMFDDTEPVFLTFDINGGDECSDNASLTVVDVTWDEVEHPDATTIYLSLDNFATPGTAFAANGTGTQQIAFSMLPAWTGTDGPYTVSGTIEDDIANMSAVVEDDIVLDGSDPTADDLMLNGGVSWSQVSEVAVDFVNPAADIVTIDMGEATGTYTEQQDYVAGTNTYDFGSGVAQNTWVNLYAQALDCSGRDLAAEVDGHVAFDFIDPVISNVTINGTDLTTTSLTVNVDFDFTEVSRLTVRISEESDMSGAQEDTWAPAGPYSFTMSAGEGNRTLYVQTEDVSGRMSLIEPAMIFVDTEHPQAGDFVIISGNSMAALGYTNSLTGNTYSFTPADADIKEILIRNMDNTGSLGWFDVSGSYPEVGALNALVDVSLTCTVEWYYKDFAGNQSGPFYAPIVYDVTPPVAPMVSGSGTGSVAIEFAPNPNHQFYDFRYNPTYDYPLYAAGPAPAPASDEGHAGYVVTGDFTFDEYPEMDILTFSFWAWDMAGNKSLDSGVCISANYMPGDGDWDGVLAFVEFGDIGASYWLSTGDGGFCEPCDFGPLGPEGEPQPNGYVGFDELTIFASKYAEFGDHGKDGSGKVGPAGPVEFIAESPYVKAGETATFSIKVNNSNAIMAYHLKLDYDRDQFEVIGVKQGAMHANIQSFFSRNSNSSKIEIDGAVMADMFTGEEVALVTVRANRDGVLDLREIEIDIRDSNNETIEAQFTVEKGVEIPTTFALSQNYPNPFNPSTTIEFSLPMAADYSLVIYNVTGQVVASFSGHADAGTIPITWDASDRSSGIYFYKLEAGSFTDTKKMIMLK